MSRHSERTEKWIVVIDTDERGRRRARRFPLQIPLALAAAPITPSGALDWSGHRISDRALSDMRADLEHELARREGRLHELGGWDPEASSKDQPRQSERSDNTTTEEDP